MVSVPSLFGILVYDEAMSVVTSRSSSYNLYPIINDKKWEVSIA